MESVPRSSRGREGREYIRVFNILRFIIVNVKEEHLLNELSNSIVDLVPSPELFSLVRNQCYELRAKHIPNKRTSIASEALTSRNRISAFE